MKKSLSKILARMARDGDIETVAEIIEEMIEPEAPAEAAAEAAEEAAEQAAEAVQEAAENPAAVVETPAGATIVLDEAALSDIVSRLDRIIELLSPAPAPAADEGEGTEAAAEELAEVVEEAVEAAAAEAESEAPGTPVDTTLEELTEIVEEILGSGEAEEPEADECGEKQEVLSTGDALRAALKTVGPALAAMRKDQRKRICADLSARLNGRTFRKGSDAGLYAELASDVGKPAENPADLGRRIMATRSANRKSM